MVLTLHATLPGSRAHSIVYNHATIAHVIQASFRRCASKRKISARVSSAPGGHWIGRIFDRRKPIRCANRKLPQTTDLH